MMYSKTELKNGFFFNLGTDAIPFENLSDVQRTAWAEKYDARFRNNLSEISPLHGASTQIIYNEFAKYVPEFAIITSIAVGTIDELKPKSFSTDVNILTGEESRLLKDFSAILDNSKIVTLTLGGYNVINYQIPFVVKKMLVHKIKIPFLLQLRNKKPWDVNIIDIMRDYQGNMFGDVNFGLVAEQFGLKVDTSNASTELETQLQLALAMSI